MQTNLKLQKVDLWTGWEWGAGRGRKMDYKGAKGNLGDETDMFTLFIVVSFTDVYMLKFTKLYTLNMCGLLYVNYTLIKLLKK